jgi:hypothetical protein
MATATASCVGAARAHHSPALLYRVDQTISIEGVVTEYRFINPHVRLFLDVARADGATDSWLAEGGTRAVLLRRGWDGSEITPGEVVRIIGNPSRDGTPLVHWISIVLPSGKELASEDLDPAELERRRQRVAP